MFSETGKKEEKVDGQPEEVETVCRSWWNIKSTEKYKYLWRYKQSREGHHMDNQRIDAIRVRLSTIADDIKDFIDENEVDENLTTSEVDCKICKIEELRASYRKLYN